MDKILALCLSVRVREGVRVQRRVRELSKSVMGGTKVACTQRQGVEAVPDQRRYLYFQVFVRPCTFGLCARVDCVCDPSV